MDARLLEELVREVFRKMSAPVGQGCADAAAGGLEPQKDYPLAEKRPDLIRTGTGKRLDELTLDSVLNNTVKAQDMRITPEALLLQAQIAEACGRSQLAQNFRRAAELTKVPDERILEIYNALRPYRSNKDELLAIADELDKKFGAVICAALVREAAEVYECRGRLRIA